MARPSSSALRHNLGQALVLVSGVLMTASGVLHCLAGWPALSEALDQASVGESLKMTIGIGWTLGGLAMLAMGFMTLLLYGQLRGNRPVARPQGIVIGLFFLLFGSGTSALSFPNAHFLSFMTLGVLMLIGLGMSRPRSNSSEPVQ